MAIERDDTDERRVRIDTMIGEFQAARQRRLLQQGITLWKRAEAAQREKACGPQAGPEKIH